MTEGGELTINAQAQKGQVHLSITDIGCGIPEEDMGESLRRCLPPRLRALGWVWLFPSISWTPTGEASRWRAREGKSNTFTVIVPSREVV